MDIDVADTTPDGWHVWLDWQRAVAARESQQCFAVYGIRGSRAALGNNREGRFSDILTRRRGAIEHFDMRIQAEVEK